MPARLLSKRSKTYCDSLSSGPFCSLTNNNTKVPTEGLIDPRIVDEMDAVSYYNLYSTLSQFAMDYWHGSTSRKTRENSITSLVVTRTSESMFEFEPFGMPVDLEAIDRSPSSSFYILNSFYGFISFVYYSVAVTEFRVRAPRDSHVLVRAYRDGLPVWFRLVRSGETLDVSQPSDREDPSVEEIDMIELIGEGAEILSLSVSFANSRESATYLYINGGSGIREFAASANLIDLQTVMEEDMVFHAKDGPTLISGQSEKEFTYASFMYTLRGSHEANLVPLKHVDFFILSLVHHAGRNFEEFFTSTLIESSPQLLSWLMKVSYRPASSDSALPQEIVSRLSNLELVRTNPDSVSIPNNDTNVEVLFEGLQKNKDSDNLKKLQDLRESLISVFNLDINIHTPAALQHNLLLSALESLLTDSSHSELESLAEMLVLYI